VRFGRQRQSSWRYAPQNRLANPPTGNRAGNSYTERERRVVRKVGQRADENSPPVSETATRCRESLHANRFDCMLPRVKATSSIALQGRPVEDEVLARPSLLRKTVSPARLWRQRSDPAQWRTRVCYKSISTRECQAGYRYHAAQTERKALNRFGLKMCVSCAVNT